MEYVFIAVVVAAIGFGIYHYSQRDKAAKRGSKPGGTPRPSNPDRQEVE